MVPVHIVGGFLGAGKTTAVRSVLRRRGGSERIAVLVNDFGEASIDAELVRELDGVRVAEVPGGCVCCTAPEGFVAALGTLLEEVRPERIFVEPTGLARPADLVDTIRRSPHPLAIAPVIVLVDPGALPDEDAARVPFLAEQAEAADVLVASKADLATPADLARFDLLVASLWPGPMRTLRTAGELPDDALDWPEGQGRRAPGFRPLDLRPSSDGFAARSHAWGPEVVFDRERLGDAIARIAATMPLERLKGLFRTEEGVWLLEVAAGRVHERPSAHRRDSRCDLIFAGDAPDVAELLDAARSEGAVDAERVELVLPDGTRRYADRDALAALPGVADVSERVPGRRGAAAELWAWLGAEVDRDDLDAVVVAADGYATPPVPVTALRTALLLHSLDGGPLPAGHGGPYRLLIPGDAGPGGPCANVKGVVRIALRDRRGPGGYDPDDGAEAPSV